jgi:hypothetical protein
LRFITELSAILRQLITPYRAAKMEHVLSV